MCAVSAVTDYYREKWPISIPIGPGDWTKPFDAPITITRKEWEHYQEIKRRMEKYDIDTGQPDCVKPDVAAWEEIVKQFVVDVPEAIIPLFRNADGNLILKGEAQ